ncbi:hypothetical protein ACFLZB_02195 [Nanoarchaeota archaeon]
MEMKLKYQEREYLVSDEKLVKGFSHSPIYDANKQPIGLAKLVGNSVQCGIYEGDGWAAVTGDLRLKLNPNKLIDAFNGLKKGNESEVALGRKVFNYVTKTKKKEEEFTQEVVERYLNQMAVNMPGVFDEFKRYILDNGFGEAYFEVREDVPMMPKETEIEDSLEKRAVASVQAAEKHLSKKEAKVL